LAHSPFIIFSSILATATPPFSTGFAGTESIIIEKSSSFSMIGKLFFFFSGGSLLTSAMILMNARYALMINKAIIAGCMTLKMD
jgi:hypothetical protein